MDLLSQFVLTDVEEEKGVAVSADSEAGSCLGWVGGSWRMHLVRKRNQSRVKLGGSRCEGEMLLQERIFGMREGLKHASWDAYFGKNI